MENEFLKVEDIQMILNIGRKKAYELVNQPDFPKIRIGRSIRINRIEFERYLNILKNKKN